MPSIHAVVTLFIAKQFNQFYWSFYYLLLFIEDLHGMFFNDVERKKRLVLPPPLPLLEI